MDALNDLVTQVALLTQQLQSQQLAYGLHQRVQCLAQNPFMPMEQVQYVGNYNKQNSNPYFITYNPGWQHHLKFSWEANQNAQQPLE